MIEVGLSKIKINYGYKDVLKGIDFTVNTGERAAIVGRNAAGKSTILKIIAGTETADSGAVSIRRGATVAMLEQIPALYDTETLTKDVLIQSFARVIDMENKMRKLEAEMATQADTELLQAAMDEYGVLQSDYTAAGGYEMEEIFSKVVSGFAIAELLEMPFNLLSGGQKTVVKLATTILLQPDILLLDEPTNHLDMSTLDWFQEFLAKYRGTLIIISHDRYFLDKVATKTIIVEDGECAVFNGNYSFALKEQERLLLIEFEQYKNVQKQIEAMRAAARRFRDWGHRGDNPKFFAKAKMLEAKIEVLEQIDRPMQKKIPVPINFGGGRSGKDVLVAEGFSLAFGDNVLLEDADLLLVEREKLCLMGDNGSGKTSFIKALFGENRHYQGKLAVNPSAKIGYVPQEIRFENDSMNRIPTVLDAFRSEYRCDEGQGRSILAKYYFYNQNVFKRVSSLSGGEKVLLKLAILIQKEINFLVLDEPTNHIDIETREMIEEALTEYRGTLLFISHDRYFISKIASRMVKLENKQFAGVTLDPPRG